MPDLTGVRAKLRRADEHRQAYDDLFARFLETQPYSILFEFDPESGWHVFRWLVTSEPPLSARSRPGVRAGPALRVSRGSVGLQQSGSDSASAGVRLPSLVSPSGAAFTTYDVWAGALCFFFAFVRVM